MDDERAIYLGLVLAGLLPVVGWLVKGGAVGAGLTLCMLMIAVGAIGLVLDAWRHSRAPLPVARSRVKQTR